MKVVNDEVKQARRDQSPPKRPQAGPCRAYSVGLHFYYRYFLIVAKTDKYMYKVYMDMEVSEDCGDGQTNSARV